MLLIFVCIEVIITFATGKSSNLCVLLLNKSKLWTSFVIACPVLLREYLSFVLIKPNKVLNKFDYKKKNSLLIPLLTVDLVIDLLMLLWINGVNISKSNGSTNSSSSLQTALNFVDKA